MVCLDMIFKNLSLGFSNLLEFIHLCLHKMGIFTHSMFNTLFFLFSLFSFCDSSSTDVRTLDVVSKVPDIPFSFSIIFFLFYFRLHHPSSSLMLSLSSPFNFFCFIYFYCYYFLFTSNFRFSLSSFL